MKKLLWAFPVAVLFLSGCSYSPGSNSTTTTSPTTAPSASQKFSDQPYFSRAYLISSDTLSSAAQAALAGFKMDKQTLPDGTVQINLKALESQYHDQSYTLKAGQQLYFIDMTMGDDRSATEINIADDTAVIVDSQGNIIQPPTGF